MTLLRAILVAGPASAADQYAAPNGVGSTCSAAAPCPLAQAFNNAAGGDHILLAGGQYDTGPSPPCQTTAANWTSARRRARPPRRR